MCLLKLAKERITWYISLVVFKGGFFLLQVCIVLVAQIFGEMYFRNLLTGVICGVLAQELEISNRNTDHAASSENDVLPLAVEDTLATKTSLHIVIGSGRVLTLKLVSLSRVTSRIDLTLLSFSTDTTS